MSSAVLQARELGSAERGRGDPRAGSGGPGAAAAARRARRPPVGKAAAARPWRSVRRARRCPRGLRASATWQWLDREDTAPRPLSPGHYYAPWPGRITSATGAQGRTAAAGRRQRDSACGGALRNVGHAGRGGAVRCWRLRLRTFGRCMRTWFGRGHHAGELRPAGWCRLHLAVGGERVEGLGRLLSHGAPCGGQHGLRREGPRFRAAYWIFIRLYVTALSPGSTSRRHPLARRTSTFVTVACSFPLES